MEHFSPNKPTPIKIDTSSIKNWGIRRKMDKSFQFLMICQNNPLAAGFDQKGSYSRISPPERTGICFESNKNENFARIAIKAAQQGSYSGNRREGSYSSTSL